MTLVEEIARAINCVWLDGEGWPESDYPPCCEWEDWAPEAQAALSVILQRLREPSDELIEMVRRGVLFDFDKEVPFQSSKDFLRALAANIETGK